MQRWKYMDCLLKVATNKQQTKEVTCSDEPTEKYQLTLQLHGVFCVFQLIILVF